MYTEAAVHTSFDDSQGVDMASIDSVRTRRAAAVLFLAVLSALPYAMVYCIDRALDAPNAARAALWPTAVVPLLVAALVLVPLLRARHSRRAQPGVVA